jgi:hypothetical protein
MKEQVEKVLTEWESELYRDGVGIRGANERALIAAIRKALDTTP